MAGMKLITVREQHFFKFFTLKGKSRKLVYRVRMYFVEACTRTFQISELSSFQYGSIIAFST